MVKEQQGKWVVPNPQIPRSFGLMNIIFGVSLALTRAGSWVLVSLHTDVHEADARALDKAEATTQKPSATTKIADLKKQEAEAKTEEEKEVPGKDELDSIEKRNERQRAAVQQSLEHERHVRQAHRRLLRRRSFRRGHPQRAHDRLRGRAPGTDGMGAPDGDLGRSAQDPALDRDDGDADGAGLTGHHGNDCRRPWPPWKPRSRLKAAAPACPFRCPSSFASE